MEQKEITKGKYKLIVWGTLIGGLILNSIVYTWINLKYPDAPLQLIGFLNVAGIIVGVGLGLSFAHTYKFKEEIK